MPSISSFVVALSAAAVSLAAHGLQNRNHHEIAKRAEANLLNKRFYSPRVTWYPTDTGPDACTGKNHGDYDLIVALNVVDWNNNKNCGRKINIHANGKTRHGYIQDRCASCYRSGEIDLTRGLFEQFYSLDKGVFEATWEYADGDDDDDAPPPPPPPPPKPKPTKKAEKPTTANFVPKVTSKPAAKSTRKSSSSVKPSSSAKPSSSVRPSSSVASSSSVVPVPLPSAPVGNVGSGPTGDEDSTASINGGISSDSTIGNSAAAATFNKFVAGAAAVLLIAQAL